MKLRLCIVSLLVAAAALTSSAFSDSDVEIVNPSSRLKLAGTLTVPDTGKAKALLVLATGSGTQDRDETIFGKKPFKAIAEHLGQRGYAVLRMDDRGAGGSEAGDIANATTLDFISDIAAVIASADSLLGYSVPKGVLGHSEGGIIATRLAATDPDVNFIITFGSPAFRGDSILMRQVHEKCLLAGATDQFESLYSSLRRRYDLVMGPGLQALIEAQVLAELATSQPEVAAIPQYREQLTLQVKALCSPWMRNFLRYDPAADISAIKIPWLAINGSLDRQVTPDNLTKIKQLCPTADTVVMDGINHIMLKASTGGVDEYDRLPGDADPALLQLITDWLDRRFPAAQSL